MRAFHGNHDLKRLMVGRCVHARENGLYERGGCINNDMIFVSGCVVSIMMGIHDHQLRDFETVFGISSRIAHIIEAVFEGLPEEAVPVYGERIAESIQVGADTETIMWPLLHRAIAEHPGSSHRMVLDTVHEAMDVIERHRSIDIIDAIDARNRTNVVMRRINKATDVSLTRHPRPPPSLSGRSRRPV